LPHIDLPDGVPGIRSAMFRPATAAPLLELAEVLLRGENALTRSRVGIAFHPEAYDEMGRRIVEHGYLRPVMPAATT
jgi:hypothetical protein